MHRSSRNFTGLSRHMLRYTIVDAKIDNPHRPARELPGLADEALREAAGLPKRRLRRLREVLAAHRSEMAVA